MLGSLIIACSNATLTGSNAAATSRLRCRLPGLLSANIALNCSKFSNGGTRAVTSSPSFCVKLLSINITLPALPTLNNSLINSLLLGRSSPVSLSTTRKGTKANCIPSGSLSYCIPTNFNLPSGVSVAKGKNNTSQVTCLLTKNFEPNLLSTSLIAFIISSKRLSNSWARPSTSRSVVPFC